MTAPNVPTSVIERIRKLLAHADSAKQIGSIEEAAAFAAKASDILAQHKLGMSDLELMIEGETDQQGKEEYEHIKRRGRTAWYETMASAVARANFCHLTVFSGSARICLTGRESDRAIASYLIQTLAVNGERLAIQHARLAMQQHKQAVAEAVREGLESWMIRKPSNPKLSFLSGYTAAIIERLHEQRKQQEAHNPHAVIRLTNALAESKAHAHKLMPNLRSVRGPSGPRSQDRNSRDAGYAAGRSANLNAGVGSGGTVRAAMRLGAGA